MGLVDLIKRKYPKLKPEIYLHDGDGEDIDDEPLIVNLRLWRNGSIVNSFAGVCLADACMRALAFLEENPPA